MKSEIRSLALPSPKSAPPGESPTTSVWTEGPLVVIGANGSGKTRLGTWIEFESGHIERVHRISAQKSLTIPPSVASVAVDEAYAELRYGQALFDLNELRNRPHKFR